MKEQLKWHEDCSSLTSFSIDFHVKNVMNYGMHRFTNVLMFERSFCDVGAEEQQNNPAE